ncbi:hypothetical protein O9993_00170 [Vibrio lentus]|nr:hypothetical protein [Vibrio lentus]
MYQGRTSATTGCGIQRNVKEQGINADEVIALRSEYMQTMKASAEAITTEFDGKKVSEYPVLLFL